jgi:hypothetical protein
MPSAQFSKLAWNDKFRPAAGEVFMVGMMAVVFCAA